MSDKSKIEWTDATWNPVRGCTKISPGCAHCYAETFAERFRGVPGSPFEQGFDLRLVPEKLGEPFRFAQPKRIFVNSMSDLFHVGVSDEYIERVTCVMAASPWHTYQVLTKRSERLRDLLRGRLRFAAELAHIWWGVSVEDQRYGLPRVEHLLQSGAAMKFLSVEPLLEDLGTVDFTGLDWVIVGGESGPGARPMPAEWVRPIRDHCVAQGVPFFFKQWGGVRKHTTGRALDGVTWDQFPLRPPVPIPPLAQRRELIMRLPFQSTLEMSKPITDLGDLICQHLTFCYASGEKRELVRMAKEMDATFEQIVAASLAQHIAEKFEVLPKAEGNPPLEARSLAE